MGIDELIEAARSAETARTGVANEKAAKERAAYVERVRRHRKQAEALMPEVVEGIAAVRLNQGSSLQLLVNGSWGPVRIAWEAGRGWTSRQRLKRRKMIGWEVITGSSPQPAEKWKEGVAAHRVFVPLQGPLMVIDREILQDLEGHVRAGIVAVPTHDHEKQRTQVEVHADKTVLALLDRLAQHLALLN